MGGIRTLLGLSTRVAEVIPTFLDLRTGKTAKGDDMSVFWWTEGNGACDCNRAPAFGPDVRGELRADFPGVCFGNKRFVAVDVVGDFGYDEGERTPYTKEQMLVALNEGYGT